VFQGNSNPYNEGSSLDPIEMEIEVKKASNGIVGNIKEAFGQFYIQLTAQSKPD
jgi:hypothetical protein